MALKFYPRLGIWKDYSGNCTLNPHTLEGRSYHWYSLVKKINGYVVLNTYRYSVTTAKHVSKMRALLQELDVEFVEIEAPHGLQDESSALEWAVSRVAELELKKLHARDKVAATKLWLRAARQLALVEKVLKLRATKKMKVEALENARINRLARLSARRPSSPLVSRPQLEVVR